ncbi:uncharacterized protein F4822DRAFT_337202 [Hypoxylon trugodes]|uniref:uncharacterized protein n=1 Tax=Hypoxylon trugodes TaxID=326681 RepID=UPI00218F5EC4|nr:uncharacterized protein F4822DRAFT_337202 [Hypoxylon trugodes]KAI1385201.1 hypothetical protein F4822DRAFT_337202 [Hypoxylon trugodes]
MSTEQEGKGSIPMYIATLEKRKRFERLAPGKEAFRNVMPSQKEALRRELSIITNSATITSRDRILHQIRANRECLYALSTYAKVTSPTAYFSANLSRRPLHSIDLFDCSNKSTALYIFDPRMQFSNVMAEPINSWMHRQWFDPYRTDVEFCRFPIKSFAVHYNVAALGSNPDTDQLIAMHTDICERAQLTTAVGNGTGDPTLPILGPLRGPATPDIDIPVAHYDSCERAHILQPLFKAFFMVATNYGVGNSGFGELDDVAKITVRLILTGITDGLSAPISFEPLRENALDGTYAPNSNTITTTMGAATKFILELEAREISAFGIRPDIKALSREEISRAFRFSKDAGLEYAKELGWVEARDGRLDEVSPRSAEWVNPEKFPLWVGTGAEKARSFTEHVTSTFGLHKKYRLSRHWWWELEQPAELKKPEDLEEKDDNKSTPKARPRTRPGR